ncbi:MAG: DNA translocase FtsK 4TM domain-containing protein, partial [bacterium]
MARSPKKRKKPVQRSHYRELWGWFLFAAALLTTLALATYQAGVTTGDGNVLRRLGVVISTFLVKSTFGRFPTLVFPILLFLWSFVAFFRWRSSRVFWISALSLFAAFWASFIIFLFDPYSNPEALFERAGWIGYTFGAWLYQSTGAAGAWTVWIFVVISALVLLLRIRPSVLLSKVFALISAAARWCWLHWQTRREEKRSTVSEQGTLEEDHPEEGDVLSGRVDVKAKDDFPPIQSRKPPATIPTATVSENTDTTVGEYQLPPLTLLQNPPPESPDAPEELKAKANRLQEALTDFGVGAKIVKVNPGPVITRFDLAPDPGVKVNRISALVDDLALALRAQAIRIQAPIPGQGAVGVEIPNRRPSTVVLKSVAAHTSFYDHLSPLAIALGQTASGDPYIVDLERMPHLLVAGTTGSGKSVCLNAIIASLLLRNPPDRLQLVIIDPKKLEMSIYNRLMNHHLLSSPELDEKVITTPENAVRMLRGVEIEMRHRYDLLSSVGVKNIEEYNNKVIKRKALTP